jgi:hypothetical protein
MGVNGLYYKVRHVVFSEEEYDRVPGLNILDLHTFTALLCADFVQEARAMRID